MKKIIKKLIPSSFIQNYNENKFKKRNTRFLQKAHEIKSDESVSVIANIIIESINSTIQTEEKPIIDRIEELRNTLIQDQTQVIVQDFGAGNPDSTRTEVEMNLGISETIPIAQIVTASKSPFWSLVLYKLIREYKHEVGIELGTCMGISAAYQGAAMKLNNKGKFISIEGSNSLAEISRKNIQSIGLNNIEIISGKFVDKLPEILEKNRPIDYIFIDGHHDEKATIEYFEMVIPYLSDQAIIVFDDISWSQGMKNAWTKIVNDNKINIAIDLIEIGICLFDKNQNQKKIYTFPH